MYNNAEERFFGSLYKELLLFRETVLRMEKEKIYGEAYKINVVTTLYEILVEQTETFPEQLVEQLAEKENILQLLYDTWMKKDDSFYDELCSHVSYETGKIGEWRKKDGQQHDTPVEIK